MNSYQLAFLQSTICYFGDLVHSTVSRFIANHDVPHMHEVSGKYKKYGFQQCREILKLLVTKNLAPKLKTQVFFNFKGGTGKTSICHQLSVMLAFYGFKVLAIDCDPQAHLSYSLGFEEEAEHATLYDVLVNKIPIKNAIHVEVYPGLDVIPSNLSLTRLENYFNQLPNREKALTRVLEGVKEEYDFILIDTNPTISTLNRNAMTASDILNIVCETQPYSLKGMHILINEIRFFSTVMEQEVLYRIIPNKYEVKTATSQEVLGALRQHYGAHIMESIIRKCEDINISAKMRLPVFCFANKKSVAVEDLKDLIKDLIKHSTVHKGGI